jgi:hypothetical protein
MLVIEVSFGSGFGLVTTGTMNQDFHFACPALTDRLQDFMRAEIVAYKIMTYAEFSSA